MDLFSILAEVKGEKAPTQKSTLKFKPAHGPKRETAKVTSTASPVTKATKRAPAKHSSPVADALSLKSARKRETARPTATATPAFRVEKRKVVKNTTSLAKLLNHRLPTPVQSSPRPEEAAPRLPLPKPATIVPAKPTDVTVDELPTPHPQPLEATPQQHARQQRRQASRRHQPAASKVEGQDNPHRQQQRVRELPGPSAPKKERLPNRQTKVSYENMSQRDLLNEAQFRALELEADYKPYLIEVLLINDTAYSELMGMFGDHFEALEFALGEVKQHNKELRQDRAAAAAKAATEKREREQEETRKAQQQAAREARNKKRQEERAKTVELASKKKEAEENVKEKKHAVEAPKQEQKRKRKISHDTNDSGYFSKPASPPETGETNNKASPKGKKRARSNDDDNEDRMPTKKAKSSKPPQRPLAPRAIKRKRKSAPVALPRAIQAGTNKTASAKDKDVEMSDDDQSDIVAPAKPVKKTTEKTMRIETHDTVPVDVVKRRTRSTYVLKEEDKGLEDEDEDEDMEDTDDAAEDEDAFVVDDGWEPTCKAASKRKLSSEEKRKLFRGVL
ncbi:hypothetical protein ACET3X_000154 [Alternaria dauci]|uniref:Uncharacterized protein n=1 Tax=Alternaria dauci TaxID=48095 RepID=A0ABR3UU68_9PLEO